jgi:hypothetical protein
VTCAPTLVRTAREQRHQKRQVPRPEEPFVDGLALNHRGSCNEAQTMTPGQAFQMPGTNPGKVGDLGIGDSSGVIYVSRIQKPQGSALQWEPQRPFSLTKDLPFRAKKPRLEGPD